MLASTIRFGSTHSTEANGQRCRGTNLGIKVLVAAAQIGLPAWRQHGVTGQESEGCPNENEQGCCFGHISAGDEAAVAMSLRVAVRCLDEHCSTYIRAVDRPDAAGCLKHFGGDPTGRKASAYK
jgi:hypothetical protein